MTLELILWVVAFFVVWELFYIFLIKKCPENNVNNKKSWVEQKMWSLFLATILFGIQLTVVSDKGPKMFPFHYERLIWEVLIVCLLTFFFLINKVVYENIQGGNKKNGKRTKNKN